MDDPQIHGKIEQLVAEEHELWEREAAGKGSDADRRRLEELKVSLDQCWDLLRQRRALREAGRDPRAAGVRRSEVVEGYARPRAGPRGVEVMASEGIRPSTGRLHRDHSRRISSVVSI